MGRDQVEGVSGHGPDSRRNAAAQRGLQSTVWLWRGRSAWLPGTLLEGKYEILDKIREGGMGTIYKVRHRLLDEIRVVKVMRRTSSRTRTCAAGSRGGADRHPAEAPQHLRDPRLRLDDDGDGLHRHGVHRGGQPLGAPRLHGPPALPLTLEIAHQTLLALGYLHRKGVVHRDVAPDNLMLTHDEDGRPPVKLIDLGIAKVADSGRGDRDRHLPRQAQVRLARAVRVPAARQTLDGRSDLYCLGVVLYELLTGVLPFEGDTVVELLKAHVFAPPRPFSQSDPEGRVPTELRGAVLKSLQKKREDRFTNAEEFDREILAIRSRYKRPEDQEEIRAELVADPPERRNVVEPATPSAQGEMDRQFAALRTPTPSRKIEDANGRRWRAELRAWPYPRVRPWMSAGRSWRRRPFRGRPPGRFPSGSRRPARLRSPSPL